MSESTSVPLSLDFSVKPKMDGQQSAQNPLVSPADMRNTYKPVMKEGGMVKKMAKGGSVASKRGDGCAARGKTKGRFV
jgi:hypothetical protein